MNNDWEELANIAAREAEEEMLWWTHKAEEEAARREAIRIADSYPKDSLWRQVTEWLGIGKENSKVGSR